MEETKGIIEYTYGICYIIYRWYSFEWVSEWMSVCVLFAFMFKSRAGFMSIAFLWRLLCNLYGILIHTNQTHVHTAHIRERYCQCFIFRSFVLSVLLWMIFRPFFYFIESVFLSFSFFVVFFFHSHTRKIHMFISLSLRHSLHIPQRF